MPAGDETGPEGRGQRTGRGKGSSLEERVSIFDSIGNSLENLVVGVKEAAKFTKKAAYYTYYTTKASLGLAAGVALAGAPALIGAPVLSAAAITNVINTGYHALILPIGITAGQALADIKNKEKPSFKKYANEVAVGGLLGGLLHHIITGISYLGALVKNAYGAGASLVARTGLALAQMPVFLRTHEYLNRALISDYKPKTWKDMTNAVTKGPLKWLVPLVVANFTLVPDYLGHSYQMPWAAGVSTTYGLLKAEKKKEEKPTQTPAGYTQPQLAGAPGYG